MSVWFDLTRQKSNTVISQIPDPSTPFRPPLKLEFTEADEKGSQVVGGPVLQCEVQWKLVRLAEQIMNISKHTLCSQVTEEELCLGRSDADESVTKRVKLRGADLRSVQLLSILFCFFEHHVLPLYFFEGPLPCQTVHAIVHHHGIIARRGRDARQLFCALPFF